MLAASDEAETSTIRVIEFILPNIILFICHIEETFLKYIGLLMPFVSTWA